MKTIAQKIIEEMEEQGHAYLGMTTGTFSFRKGSNLYHRLLMLNRTEDQVIVKQGARAGRRQTEGYQLLIFSK